ncbi:class I SAM-dependent methyltransferase [Hyphomicrobium facile]|uniref:Methyltransferase domain-containing protein n=1 Tax=Hyphomicrobium facile TaxID=51670 RepID=A0A1I7NES4_9HYPH|nr:class I SAM-dependent methyltransferase [Hyphomicrobium facile]SFV33174.1 hypothetical protein SAMN04488557_1865 [Hyphomicrobium facile]
MVDYTNALNILTDTIKEATDSTVQAGPFKGMKLPDDSSWYGGDVLPKLLGVYESEIQLAVEDFIRRPADLVVNLGCAEGYYAVGLARRLNCPVYAIDKSEKAIEVSLKAAELNGVADKIRLKCSTARFRQISGLLSNADRPCLLVDCEGGEKDIFFVDADFRVFERSQIIIECHEHVEKNIASKLIDRLIPSHECRLIRQGSRNPHELPHLANVSEAIKWLAISENRPETMQWLVAHPRPR